MRDAVYIILQYMNVECLFVCLFVCPGDNGLFMFFKVSMINIMVKAAQRQLYNLPTYILVTNQIFTYDGYLRSDLKSKDLLLIYRSLVCSTSIQTS